MATGGGPRHGNRDWQSQGNQGCPCIIVVSIRIAIMLIMRRILARRMIEEDRKEGSMNGGGTPISMLTGFVVRMTAPLASTSSTTLHVVGTDIASRPGSTSMALLTNGCRLCSNFWNACNASRKWQREGRRQGQGRWRQARSTLQASSLSRTMVGLTQRRSFGA